LIGDQVSFFTTLNYSSCNEDGLTELKALDISPSDSVCCITGSGDRPLHLLLGDPARILAFDLNPAQNYLLELKLAAIREFDYPEFVQFLGLHPSVKPRWESYHALRPQLSAGAARWFDDRRRMLERGILYEGRWERYFRMASVQMCAMRGKKIRQLFAFDDLEKQRQFVHEQWNTAGWRLFLRLSFNPVAFRFVLRDPGFYAYADPQRPAWKYIYERMTEFLENHLARSSFMMALVFHGRFFDPLHYPPYLREENFDFMKTRIGRITYRTAALADVISDPALATCNKYSLSDVSSFLSTEDYQHLLASFAKKRGVRFCLRDFLTCRTPPAQSEAGGLRFLTELQEQLAREDTSLGYLFTIGVTDP
jgi:S-adenosylmethionine-diacylglycerol 3-amino-3-carboxypropyl transferase